MNIPEDTNTRAMQLWHIISQHVDFRKRYVADLGCGHGEMLWRCLIAGAEHVCGFDKEMKPNAVQQAAIYSQIMMVDTDLSEAINHGMPYWLRENTWGVALCLSVLPYLDNHTLALKWMARHFPVTVLEVQYEPEPYNIGIANDEQMFTLLRQSGFKNVHQIGRTYIRSRNAHRTVWKCLRKHHE